MSEIELPGIGPTEKPSDEIRGSLRQLGANAIADTVRSAAGLGPFEEVTVYAPPHRSRGDGMEVKYIPRTMDEFVALRGMPQAELTRIGLRRWDESGLMLFPVEWFPFVPEGFEVVDIFGEVEAFDPGTADDDGRFGVLSFGIIPTPTGAPR